MIRNMTEYQFIEVEKELNELKKWTLTFNKNMNIKLNLQVPFLPSQNRFDGKLMESSFSFTVYKNL